MDRPKKAGNGLSKKQFISAVFSLACFALLYRLGVPALGQEMGAALAVIAAGVLLWVLVTGASSLLGFILVIQTLPGVIVYRTGELNAMDFIKAGGPLTVASIVVLSLAARFWWPFLETLF